MLNKIQPIKKILNNYMGIVGWCVLDGFRLLIITGLSGAGKTQVVRSLEDMGFFCVDNLPPALIAKFAELCRQSAGKVSKIALFVDIRGGDFFDTLVQVLEEIEHDGINYEILFLEASEETLIRRYKETRRRHPLAPQGRLVDGIRKERNKLEHLKGRANYIIDTSDMSTAQLRTAIEDLFTDGREKERMSITVVSFGFKYGIPKDADMVFDVRFLPNPYYVEAMRNYRGIEPFVNEYIWKWPITQKFMEKLWGLVEFLVPHFVKEGKGQLIIAVGCTGGLHRSVAIAQKLHEELSGQNYKSSIVHRDIEKNLAGVKRS
jgi:UPF0042 nucleotide-binding protein